MRKSLAIQIILLECTVVAFVTLWENGRNESCLCVIMNAGFNLEVLSGPPPPLRFLDYILLIDSVWIKALLGGFLPQD